MKQFIVKIVRCFLQIIEVNLDQKVDWEVGGEGIGLFSVSFYFEMESDGVVLEEVGVVSLVFLGRIWVVLMWFGIKFLGCWIEKQEGSQCQKSNFRKVVGCFFFFQGGRFVGEICIEVVVGYNFGDSRYLVDLRF